jgi:hypothetical protein
VAFGGNVSVESKTVSVEPRDNFRQRVYLAHLGLWLSLDSGQFERVTFDEANGALELWLAPADAYTPVARLRIERTADVGGAGAIVPVEKLIMERGAYVVPLSVGSSIVRLGPGSSATNKEMQ